MAGSVTITKRNQMMGAFITFSYFRVGVLREHSVSCLPNASVRQRRPIIAPAAVWCNASWAAY